MLVLFLGLLVAAGALFVSLEAFFRGVERRTRWEVNREIARQNALTALELALRELQPLVRQGTYVTATAANGVRAERNGHWPGLWRVENGEVVFDRWLLSVPPNQVHDPRLPERFQEDSVAIFRGWGLDERCPVREIRKNGRCVGHYGFWISDENGKVWLGRIGGEGIQSLVTDLEAGWQRMFPHLDKTYHSRTELWRDFSKIQPSLLRQITWNSWGVLQNTKGELLTDLSSKILNFTPDEFLFPPSAGFPPPPTFALLASHFQQKSHNGFVEAVPGGPFLRQRYPCLQQVPPAEREETQRAISVHPILCGHWLTAAAERLEGKVRILLVPIFALWNPLAVAIRQHNFTVELRTVESPDRPSPSYLPKLLIRSQRQPQGQLVPLGDGETGVLFLGTCDADWAPGEVKFFSPAGWQTSSGGAMEGALAEGIDRGGWEVLRSVPGSGSVEVERLWSPALHHSRWDGLTLRLWDGDTCIQEVADFSDDVPSNGRTVVVGQRLLLFQLSAVLRAGTGTVGDCRWLANYNPRAPQIRRSAYEHFPLPAVPAQLFHRHFAPWRMQFVELPTSSHPTQLPVFFGDHQDRAIIFAFPTAITSLACIGQIPLTPFSYHPAVTVGSSWAPPLLPRDRTHYLALPPIGQEAEYFHRECRMDYAYLLNEALYDHYYVGQNLVSICETGHMDEVRELSSARLLRIGAFNVNSATVDGWKLLLRSLPYDGLRRKYYVERFPGQRYLTGNYQSTPTLSEDEVDRLAECIAAEICRRGPFARLSQFVNRNLGSASDPSTLCGTLQAAIEAAQLRHFPDLRADDSRNREWFDEIAAAGDSNSGAPGDLTQADLLHYLGNALTVRGDTFSIRSYGDSSEQLDGEEVVAILAEALVRRLPNGSLELVQFRWLEENGDTPFFSDIEK